MKHTPATPRSSALKKSNIIVVVKVEKKSESVERESKNKSENKSERMVKQTMAMTQGQGT